MQVTTRGIQVRAHEPTDADLVAAARAGEQWAHREIYRRHRAVVGRVVRERLGRQGDPEDVVQEVFAAAAAKLDGLRDPDQLRSWLLQIARRKAIDQGRRHRRRPVSPAPEEVLAETPDPGAGPDELSDLADLVARLDGALAGLSRRDALAISLATHLGLGPAEIGAALDVTPGNAKVILHRARRRLRAAIEEPADHEGR